MHSKTLSIGAAVVLVTAASTAFAQPAKGVIELTRFDLGTTAGQTKLDRTIRRTALQMCATDSTIDMPQAKHLQRLCYEDAVASAHAQLAGHAAQRTSAQPALATLDAEAPGTHHD